MATTGELTILVEQLKKELEREVGQRAKDIKYMEHMVEDVQARYRDIAVKMSGIEAAMRQHFTEDAKMTKSIDDMSVRLRHMERMAWVGFGGLAVLWGAINIAAPMLK